MCVFVFKTNNNKHTIMAGRGNKNVKVNFFGNFFRRQKKNKNKYFTWHKT